MSITPHRLMVLRQKKQETFSWKHWDLGLFAFSVSVFQREKVSSDPSHMHYRYMGRSGIKGRGFNNITFLRFAVPSAERAQRAEMASEMWSSPGKHRCPYEFIDAVNGRWNSRKVWFVWMRNKTIFWKCDLIYYYFKSGSQNHLSDLGIKLAD